MKPDLDMAGGSISWMARNPVAANMLMVAFIVGGFLMARYKVRQEVFPSIELDRISISVPYPGASPEEVEQGIVLAIEEAVRPLDGIKEVTGTAMEGAGVVSVELEVGTDQNKALADVKNRVDRIITFPEDAEKPVVSMPAIKREAIWLVVHGDLEEKVLHELGEQARSTLLAHPDVSYVELDGVRPLEISIEVSQDTLRTYGLTLPGVAATVRRTALELPAGGIKTDGGEVLLRTAERRDLGSEFSNISVISTKSGGTVKLDDIAEIEDGYAETDMESRFEGQPCVVLKVFSVGDESPTEVAMAAKEVAETLRDTFPPGVGVATWRDRADMYAQRLDLLVRNAMIGLVLVLLVLGLFLEPRLAFWVTMGIPISFLGGFLILPSINISLNMISLFAFIVTLGMVVDDAIVVGESIFRQRRAGVPRVRAAIDGAREVAMPVFFSIATTIVAFSPLLFIPGIRGKFMFSIPAVVITVLAISLIESFFVLPSHLSHVVDIDKTIKSKSMRRGLFWLMFPVFVAGLAAVAGLVLSGRFGQSRLVDLTAIFVVVISVMYFLWPRIASFQKRFSLAVERFVEHWYAPFLRGATRGRWITLSIGVALDFSSCGLVSGGKVKFIDFPKEESDWLFVDLGLPFGVSVEETREVMQRMVRGAREVIEEHGGERISKGIFSHLGSARTTRGTATGSHLTSIGVMLVPTDQRDISSHQFVEEWRKKIGEIPGLEFIRFDASVGRGETPPIDIRLSHRNPEMLEAAAVALADELRTFAGLKDIDDGIELGKPQLDFTVSEEGARAGLTSADLASQVRSSYYGAEALRQQRGRNEIKVMVRLPLEERQSLADLEDFVIRTPTGGEMLLTQAARVEHGRAYDAINRVNGERIFRVQADVVEGEANAQEVMEELFKKTLPALRERFPGLTWERAGRQKSNEDFMDFLVVAFAFALLGIFGLIAVPLKSVLQPVFVVMMAIPFGFVGAVLGHWAMGLDWSIISWMGLVALSGVVVNDSLVLVNAANRFRDQGMSRFEAGEAAAVQRFRPIVLTSLTTFGGLAPMIFETSVQARIMIPMAVGLGFGVLFSTLITLLLVPSLFVMVERPREWWASRFEQAEPGTVGDSA